MPAAHELRVIAMQLRKEADAFRARSFAGDAALRFRHMPAGWIGAGIVGAIVLAAIFAPAISGHDLLALHVLPNIATPLLVKATLGIDIGEPEAAGLSYLGLGARPPAPEWGAMLDGARDPAER